MAALVVAALAVGGGWFVVQSMDPPDPQDPFDPLSLLEDCEPHDNPVDPYPTDRLFAIRDAVFDDDTQTVHIAGCLVNGRDSAYQDRAFPENMGIVDVRAASDDQDIVFARPSAETGFPAADTEVTLPANAEWDRVHIELAWEGLVRDACDPDSDCGEERQSREGEPIPAGDYVVSITYPGFLDEPGWTKTLTLPAG